MAHSVGVSGSDSLKLAKNSSLFLQTWKHIVLVISVVPGDLWSYELQWDLGAAWFWEELSAQVTLPHYWAEVVERKEQCTTVAKEEACRGTAGFHFWKINTWDLGPWNGKYPYWDVRAVGCLTSLQEMPVFAKDQGTGTHRTVFKIGSWISGTGRAVRTEGDWYWDRCVSRPQALPCSQMSYLTWGWPPAQSENVMISKDIWSFPLPVCNCQATFLFRWIKLLSLLLLHCLTCPARNHCGEIPCIKTEMQRWQEQNNNASHYNE